LPHETSGSLFQPSRKEGSECANSSIVCLIALGGTNSAGVRVASDEEYWKTADALGSDARGKGRMWITASKTSRADYTPSGLAKDRLGVSDHSGTILWIKFSVEVKLPKPN
jgi:hypothetical protein